MQYHNHNILNQTDFFIIFILGALTFCIAFGLSSPALLINDEWITVNQVHQLASHSDSTVSMGKYGNTYDNEKSSYFIERGNLLAYSLFLPILSLPAMYGIMGVGDQFRLILLIFWFFLGIVALLASIWLLDNTNHKKLTPFVWVMMVLFLILFLINLYYYQPFRSSFIDSPIESAAVVLTNEILFSFMPSIIYITFRNLSIPRKTAILGALYVICCSSYLIWSSTAKDHLLVAFLLSSIFCIFSSIVNKESNWKWFSLFALSGLLCWARLEYGIVVMFGVIFWVLFHDFIIHKDVFYKCRYCYAFKFFAVFAGIAISIVPLLLNNYRMTGNPLIPSQYLYLTTGRGSMTSVLGAEGGIINKGILFLHQIIVFFSPNINNIFVDIPGILIAPANDGIGLLVFCPIILPALLYLIINHSVVHNKYSNNIRVMLLFAGFISVITVLGYLRVLHGSTISIGSLPDMRYFSPLYLPLGIISVLLLSPVIIPNIDRWLRYFVIVLCLGIPLVLVISHLLLPFTNLVVVYMNISKHILLFILILIFALIAWSQKTWNSMRLFPLLCTLLILVPSMLQIVMVTLDAVNKTQGYAFWQPIMQYLVMSFFVF